MGRGSWGAMKPAPQLKLPEQQLPPPPPSRFSSRLYTDPAWPDILIFFKRSQKYHFVWVTSPDVSFLF